IHGYHGFLNLIGNQEIDILGIVNRTGFGKTASDFLCNPPPHSTTVKVKVIIMIFAPVASFLSRFQQSSKPAPLVDSYLRCKFLFGFLSLLNSLGSPVIYR